MSTGPRIQGHKGANGCEHAQTASWSILLSENNSVAKHQNKETDAAVKQSLIPIVSKEEKRLREMLDEARAQALGLVDQAREGAKQRIEAAKSQFPELVRQARQQHTKALDAEVAREQDLCRQQVAALERTAGENLDAAVAHIIALVLPKGRP